MEESYVKEERTQKKRFADVTGEELDQIELNRNSARTKMQTTWAVGVFKVSSFIFNTLTYYC